MMMMMTIKKILLLFLLICTASVTFSQKKDFGIWAGISAEKKLVKNLELNFDINLRTYHNVSEIEEAFFDIGLNYKFNKYLSAGLSYRYTQFREDDELFHPRHKWFADVRGKFPLGDFDISARFRFQQRHKTYFEDENDRESKEVGRLKLKALYNIPKFPVNPYLSAELFFPMFSVSERTIEKERFTAGFEYKISKKHSVEVEYMFQRDFFPKLSDMNIISVNYNIKF